MTAQPILSAVAHEVPRQAVAYPGVADGWGQSPGLRLVEADAPDVSTALHEQYFALRREAVAVEKPEGETLARIQGQVRAWATTAGPLRDGTVPTYEQYASHDMDSVRAKILGLTEFLRTKVPEVSGVELAATELFLSSTEAMYNSTPEDGSVHPDADGSFAFVVPARMSRKNVEYGQEVEAVIAALRYVPRELRSAFMVGLPPFVIDWYNPGADGKRGYIVFAPVYPDMQEDLSLGQVVKVGKDQVNKAVDFAYGRLGAEVIGLGAILPKLTKFGQYITNPNVITTTGHGGTIQLIFETMRRAIDEGRVSEDTVRKIGVLGLGTIGESIARIARAEYPDAQIAVYDPRGKGKHAERVADEIGALAAENEQRLIEESQIIISALPDIRIHLRKLGLTNETMKGKLLVDDSQPGALDQEEVSSLGATLAWVVGQDGDAIRRSGYTYGSTLAGSNDLFGCEAEAAAITMYRSELIARGAPKESVNGFIRRIAIREAVTPDMVRIIGFLFDRYGITAAPLQAFGKHI